MTRDEFYAGLQVAGKTLNPTEVGVLVSLTWDAATKAERECAAKGRRIGTAPKDGSAMLLFDCPLFGESNWGRGYWDRDPRSEGGLCWRDDEGERIIPRPTHWMPLPPTP